MRISLKTVVAASLLLLTVNAGYIWAFASPTVLYMGSVLAHLFIGIIFVVSGAALLARDRPSRSGWRVQVAAGAMLAAFAFGAFLVYRGNILEVRWALQAHIATALLGVVASLLHVWQRSAPGTGHRRFAGALQAAVVFLVALPIATTLWVRSHPNPNDRIVNPLTPPLTASHEGS